MFKTKKMDKEFMITKFEQYLKEYQYKVGYYDAVSRVEPEAVLRHHYLKMYLRYNELVWDMDSELRRLGVTPIYNCNGSYEKLLR